MPLPLLIGSGQVLLGAPAFGPGQLAGLALWLRSDRGLFQDSAFATPAAADTDPVGGWLDFSGNGNHGVQATAGQRPLLKLAIVNGIAVLRFNGTDQHLTVPDSASMSPSTLTAFVVLNATNATGEAFSKTTVSTEDYKLSFSANHLRARVTDSGGLKTVTTATTDNNAWIIGGLLIDGTNMSIFKNGALAAAALAAGNAIDTSGAKLGIGAFWPTANGGMAGDIAEAVMYNRVLSTPERKQVEGYLGARYGIVVS